jgi:hypothetical protein
MLILLLEKKVKFTIVRNVHRLNSICQILCRSLDDRTRRPQYNMTHMGKEL